MNVETVITSKDRLTGENGLAPGNVSSRVAEKRIEPSRPIADANQGFSRIQELIETIDAWPDINARRVFQECLQSLLALYGEGLERILQLTRNAGVDGEKVMDALVRDKLVRSLLLVHNLHPKDLEARLQEALDKVRPYLQSHGGNVELISLADDTARLRLQGTCQSCPSSSVTLELAVRQAVEEACPDLIGFEVEGAASPDAARIPRGADAPRWEVVEGLDTIQTGTMRAVEVDEEPVVVCRVKASLYAFRNRCAVCAATLESGTLEDDLLRCPTGHAFDVRRAGVCSDDSSIHLDPWPLLAADGIVKIAVKH